MPIPGLEAKRKGGGLRGTLNDDDGSQQSWSDGPGFFVSPRHHPSAFFVWPPFSSVPDRTRILPSLALALALAPSKRGCIVLGSAGKALLYRRQGAQYAPFVVMYATTGLFVSMLGP